MCVRVEREGRELGDADNTSTWVGGHMGSQEGNSARRQQANTLILTVVRVVRLHLATAHLAALGHPRQTTPVPLPPPTALFDGRLKSLTFH